MKNYQECKKVISVKDLVVVIWGGVEWRKGYNMLDTLRAIIRRKTPILMFQAPPHPLHSAPHLGKPVRNSMFSLSVGISKNFKLRKPFSDLLGLKT